jgi:dTDP-4-amino-4,6-dideoxygalactose transaminase
MSKVKNLADKYGWKVIEDSAECQIHHSQSEFEETQYSDAQCWSFYRNKVVGGEEGGAVAFRDVHVAIKARRLRSLGLIGAHTEQKIPRGMSCRLSNANAKVIFPRLRRWMNFILPKRRKVESWYNQYVPSEWQMPTRACPWVYDLRLRGVCSGAVSRIVLELLTSEIVCRRGFYPISQQIGYKTFRGAKLYPNSYKASGEVIYLPITVHHSQEIVEENVKTLIEAVEKYAGESLGGVPQPGSTGPGTPL